MHFWGVVTGVVNIIGVARGRFHLLPVGVAMVPEGSLKKLEPIHSHHRHRFHQWWSLVYDRPKMH